MKRWTFWAKVAASLVFVGFLCRQLDMAELAAQARHVDPVFLALSGLFSFLMVAASTWKWWYLMRLQGFAIPFVRMYRWYFIGYFYSNFLPSNVGGDVARAWLAGREVRAPGAALVAVFAERFTGMVFLLALAVGLPFTSPVLWRHPAVALGIVAGTAGLGAIGLAWWGGQAGLKSAAFGRLAANVRRWIRADRPGRTQHLWDRIAGKAGVVRARAGDLGGILRRRPGAFGAVVGLTALFYVLMIGNVAVAYRAFGAWPDLAALACVLPAAVMVAMIPVTLGNVGITEGSYVFYFGLIGMGPELTLAMGLLLRLKIILMGVIGMFAQAGLKTDDRPHG